MSDGIDRSSFSDFDVEDIYRLSPAQEGMLMHTLREPESGLFFLQKVLPLKDLDVPSFLRAWRRVVDRHPILRTSFHSEGLNKPVQVVHAQVELPVEHLDWRGLPRPDREHQLRAFLRADRQRGWVLTEAPLLRLTLIRLSQTEYLCVRSHHHILMDGWSGPRLFREVQTLYGALRQGRDLDLPLPRPFRDYIAWLQRQDPTEAEAFWREQLAGFTVPTPLPGARRVEASSRADERFLVRSLSLSGGQTAKLESVARGWQTTLSTLIQGAWALLLSLSAGEEDVVFGVAVSGRPVDLDGVESMVGLFINGLPMRVRVKPERPLEAWLRGLHDQQVQLQRYQHNSLVELQGWSGIPRGLPLFETLVIFNSESLGGGQRASRGRSVEGPASAKNQPSVKRERNANQSLTVQNPTNDPLSLTVYPGEELVLELTADARRFEVGTLLRLLEQLRLLLEEFATVPTASVGELSLLTLAERHRVVHDWNQTRMHYSRDVCLHHLFEERVNRTPEAVAVVCGSQDLTYRELNRRANQLAHHLQRLGVGPETLVGLCVERSVEMVVGLLGILKAGGAYVPLDPAYPKARLAFMLADTRAPVLVTQATMLPHLGKLASQVVCLDRDQLLWERQSPENPEHRTDGDNLAYVLYTSGSTGVPKGVLGLHHGAVNYLAWLWRTYPFAAGEVACQKTPLSFVDSLWELFAPLLQGVPTVLVPDAAVKDTARLVQTLAQHGVTRLVLVPSLLSTILDATDSLQRQVPKLRLWIASGEALSADLLSRFQHCLPDSVLVNLYGQSEVSAVVTGCDTQLLPPGSAAMPIGRPIANTQVYLLDTRHTPVPIGVSGELYAGGEGLSRGYLNRSALTAERFIPHPFSSEPGARLYRTGDLARYLPDGAIEFLGRVDDQVKIRGVRIELQEVESVLRQHDRILQAAVAVTGDERLAAYVVPKDGPAPDGSEMREFLRSRLPENMIPSLFLVLEALPLTPSGKVDRRALPTATPDRIASPNGYVAPRTPTEELVADAWTSVLNVPRVGVDENFFELGGHSLMATQVASRLRRATGVSVPIPVIFDRPTVAGLADWIEGNRDGSTPGGGESLLAAATSDVAVRQGDGRREAPQSFAQQRLWFLSQLAPGSSLYNTMTIVPLHGVLDLDALERSLTELMRRHESLRTTFGTREGDPIQLVAPPSPARLSVVDLRGLPTRQRQAELEQLRRAEAAQPFDLARGPLVRFKLLRLEERRQLLLVSMHHIITDGWSMGVLRRELQALYEAFSTGQPSPLPEPSLQYADFAIWQRQWLQGDVLQEQLDYWKERLAGAAYLEPPTDRPRPAVPRYASARQSFRIERHVVNQLRDLGQQEEATLFMTLLAAFQVLLGRYGGQDDVVVGTPIANRVRVELEDLVGIFVNTLAMRTDLSGDPSFRTLLRRVRQGCLDAYAHQDLPFEKLVEELSPQRDLGVQPLFQVLFVLQNAPQAPAEVAPRRPNAPPGDAPGAAGLNYFDLTLSMTETESALSGALHFNTDLFDPATAERMVRHFETLLVAVADHPDQNLSGISLLSPHEREQLLSEHNASASAAPEHCIHRLFEQQVDRTPHHIAVTFEDQRLSYRDLDRSANRLAHRLRTLGVRAEVPVGLHLERGPAAIVALLGILKAGGVYVPLDPGLPPERLGWLLADARPAVLLTEQALRPSLPDCGAEVLCLDDAEANLQPEPNSRLAAEEVTPGQLAYIIYTSGSTGRPKGVMVEHRSLSRTIIAQLPLFEVTSDSRVLPTIALSFDASLGEIFRTLLAGATLCLARREELLPGPDLIRLLRDQRITTTTMVTTVLAALPVEELPDLKVLTVGGEALAGNLAARWSQGRRLLNGYGPTEATIGATLATEWEPSRKPPLGRPLPHVRAYVLDTRMELLPVGIAGELYLGGSGLARGYLNRPDLTAERFLADPLSREPGARLYRTGDRVRWQSDGQLEFLGRVDDQVKVHGHRIEPDEIAAVLRQHTGVREAAVLARQKRSGDQHLVAYVVPAHGSWGRPSRAADDLAAEWQRASEAAAVGVAAAVADPKSNFTGWVSSYTGQPIPLEEMRHWADSTVERITRLRPREVLEIGSRAGLILFRLAPHCRRYLGVDFSAGLLEQARRHLHLLDGTGCQVDLWQRRADDLHDLPDGSFDCVVLNSVVQYFPDPEYLLRVLQGAVRLTKAGGKVFIGDVRNLVLLEAFHASVQLSRAAATLPSSLLAQRARRRSSLERELALDPALFAQLLSSWPRLSHVQVLPKAGATRNELIKFRYDVVLHVEGNKSVEPGFDWRTWQWETPAAGLQALRETLGRGPSGYGLRGVPNARTLADAHLLSLLESRPELQTVAELRQELARSQEGVEPERLTALGPELGYDVELSWLNCDAEGRYDVLFSRQQAGATLAFPVEGAATRPWRDYANDPAKAALDRNLTVELRDHLGGQLPEYMVPSAFVLLEALPLTANGKLDRRAMPRPEIEDERPDLGARYVAPRTPVEHVLAGIWADVLGLERVGVHDNFFELGGDSILSIRVIARANQASLNLTTQDAYRLQTVAEQAVAAGNADVVVPEQGQVTGAVPLTPIQHWFFEGERVDPDHFNWSTFLPAPPGVSTGQLRRALKMLLEHHDALRLRFVRSESGDWQQFLAEADDDVPLTVMDLSGVAANKRRGVIEARAAELQTSLDLDQGPLLRLAWFVHGQGSGSRLPRSQSAQSQGQASLLLLTVHHLVVDAVSWPILLGDLTSLLRQAVSDQPMQLPAKTSPFKEWAERLLEHARSAISTDERRYWLDERRREVARLPRDHPKGFNSRASEQEVVVTLDERETRRLQSMVRSTRSSIDEVVVAALGQALLLWTEDRRVLIDVERHGREDLGGDLNLSRTVGWFANIAPALLDLPRGAPREEALQAAQEQLRAIPNRGIGYGLLRYLGDEEARSQLREQPQAEVFFNYLGQRGSVRRKSSGRAAPRPKVGPLHGPRESRRYPIEINVVIEEGQLQMRWSYSANLHERASIDWLTNEFVAALQAMLTLGHSRELDTLKAEAFPEANLDNDEFATLLRQLSAAEQEV
jgi:amino acid adenylation domain-containing protein/non-ribosomal peptide synthase protein (TIGR01720 family)